MNIAFVSAIMPYPLHSGGQVRVYNVLKRLSKNHTITLYAFIRNDAEKAYLQNLSFCTRVVPIYRGRAWQFSYIARSVLGSLPFLYATYKNEVLRALLSDDISRFDLVHIEPGYVFPSIPADLSIPLVVCEHNIEHTVYEGYTRQRVVNFARPFFRQDVEKMKRWQTRIWDRAHAVITVSDDDKAYIHSHSTQKKVTVVPNGVDTDYFRFTSKKKPNAKNLKFLYVGNFSWIQNTDAIEHILTDIWPPLLNKFPGATFTIIGRHFPEKLRGLSPDSVRIIDQVEDIRSAYLDADALLAPVRIGGGTRYKVLEAMAIGLPVITSTLGASGLGVSDKKEVYVASSPEEVLRSVDGVLSEPIRKKLVLNARSLIESNYSWETIASLQDACWKSV